MSAVAHRLRRLGLRAFNPADVAPRYWLDRSSIADGMASWAPLIDTQTVGLTAFGAGANAPTPIGYSGGSIYFPGSSGNTLSAPANAAIVRAGGNLEVTARVRADDWTIVGNQTIASVFPGSNTGWEWRLPTGGLDNLLIGDGVATPVIAATMNAGLTDATWYWRKITYVRDTGAGQYAAEFYAAPDSPTEPASWTQTGATVTGASLAIASNTAPFYVGSRVNSNLLFGRVSRLIVRDGPNGAIVADYDARLSGQTGYVDAYGNTWAPAHSSSGRKTVTQSPAAGTSTGVLLVAADDLLTPPTGAAAPAANSDASTTIAVFRPKTTQAANAVVFTTRAGTGAGITLRMASATTLVADVSDGTTTNTTGAVTFTPGQRLVAVVTLSAGGTAALRVNGTTSTTAARPANTQTATGFQIAATTTPSNHLDAELEALITVPSELTAPNLLLFESYYGAGL